MKIAEALPDLKHLHEDSLGDPGIVIAILDGPVALDHPALQGARLRPLGTLVSDPAGMGPMSRHGTHVTSLIFGQPGSDVLGVAPRCQGLVVPVFGESPRRRLPQLDLARAIEQSAEEGAHIINVSGGELSPDGEPEEPLRRALEYCAKRNVTVIAAGGNDGCECLHVPAAFPTVLAVGAADQLGEPLPDSNWGERYRLNGVLAPGAKIEGAIPGGATQAMTGSSFATPLVTGVVALLLGYQLRHNGVPDPRGVAGVIRETATPCLPRASPECARDYRGALNVTAARAAVLERNDLMSEDREGQLSPQSAGKTSPPSPPDSHPVSGPAIIRPGAAPAAGGADAILATVTGGAAMPAAAGEVSTSAGDGHAQAPVPSIAGTPGAAGVSISGPPDPSTPGSPGASTAGPSGAVTPSAAGSSCGCSGTGKSLVYALGQIGFDFGTEARRDTFRQLMPPVLVQRQGRGTAEQLAAPNPYAIDQLTDYLNSRPSESTKLIWTLNLDLTPTYAIEAEADAYADEVYEVLRTSLRCSALDPADPEYISRVSIPGVLTNRTVRLFSGQVLPVVTAQPRGLYAWRESALVDAVAERLREFKLGSQWTPEKVKQAVRFFLDKIYFQLRNLGYTSSDRALNYAGTNAFMFMQAIIDGLASGDQIPGVENVLYSLDTINVSKSPYCRLDSDCWDVVVSFFNPNNDRQARVVWQYTIDVSDVLPVSLAPAHQYLTTS